MAEKQQPQGRKPKTESPTEIPTLHEHHHPHPVEVQQVQPEPEPPITASETAMSPGVHHALNHRGTPNTHRANRRRELFAALLPMTLQAGPPASPANIQAIKNALVTTDIALVMEEEYEAQNGLPSMPLIER